LWLAFDPSSSGWNAIATQAVIAMTLFIQRANRRDTLARHARLDELLRVDHAARSELTQLDEEPETILRHRDEEERKANSEPHQTRRRSAFTSMGCLKFLYPHQIFSGNERCVLGLFRHC
jgi:low affinity Fe/Cu permease